MLFSANIFAQSNDLFLGIKLRAEVQSLVKEVEKKTGKKIDIEEVRKIYAANNWKRSLQEGKAIADIISQANPQTPKDAENIFLQCILKLYTSPNSPLTFKLTLDPSVKAYRQMIINTAKQSSRKN